ncbi:MAG: adenylate/guanylate cyclase domain-containing protein [Geminicoccaceae bacterium]
MWIRNTIEGGGLAGRLRRLIGPPADPTSAVRAVMFTDIVGFTRLAETLAPQAVHAFLDRHVRLLSKAIHDHGGTVEKVVGDGMVAYWDLRDGRRPLPALPAALLIRRLIGHDNARRGTSGEPPVRLRVGLHAGPVHRAPLGGRQTLCGDTVNVTQRLEDAARHLRPAPEVAILASDVVVAGAGAGYRFRDLGPLAMRGRDQTVRAYALDDG